MSSRYVRNLTEGWAEAAGTASGVPFHPTVNLEVNTQDPIWFTLEWDVLGQTKLTYCENFIEDGQIRLCFFSQVGIGYDEAFQQIEETAAYFFDNTDPAGRLVLMVLDPPDEFGSLDTPWFMVEVLVSYQFYE